ncbi:hypothetical protein [Streptomyces formicae]|uniref:Uncharacterized protein n=1 Tax=Streptomyces formicae TaxID=1616117 RepID=A0ABY3WMB3_9ACTN|nr:hypothetical protein [Streptomyces formicae]UNM13741.1 hypothetical protein J4032_21835 [Streptomyces formicae]
MTKGQQFAKSMRDNHGIGTRTRRFRKGADLHAEILESIRNATHYNGWYSEARQELFRAAFGAQVSYQKHIAGHRADSQVIAHINSLSPYQFCALLGRMVDAEISNVGEGEQFFSQLRAELYAQAA